jgi:cell division protein FtsI (penicillin-binding protein 3)
VDIKGKRDEIQYALKSLLIPYNEKGNEEPAQFIINTRKDSIGISLQAFYPENQLRQGMIPDLTGMNLRDAIFLLENNGIHVEIKGAGKVRQQSLSAGTKFNKGTKITLQLG